MKNIFNLDNPDSLALMDVKYYPIINDKKEDLLVIIYEDLKENKVKFKEIKNPKMWIFFTKPEFRNYNYIKSAIPREQVYGKEVSYKNIVFEIAKELQDKELSNYLNQCLGARNFKGLKQVHLNKYVFASDLDIVSYVYIMWNLNYSNNLMKKPKSLYMDIEVDSYHVPGFPTYDKCPIDVITIVDDCTNTSYTFILKVKDNMDNINNFIENLNEFKDEISKEFGELYGDMEYKFAFYDDEISMLKDLFRLINSLKRTFLFIWNMNFDIPYIINRAKHLGADLKDIICDKSFSHQHLRYIEDNIHFSRAKKVERFEVSSCTKYLCQLNNYAAIRNGQKISSYRLNNIAKAEIRDEKYDYSEEANMKTLSRRNFKLFIKYNIKDVLLQMGIGRKTKDPEFLFHSANYTSTSYDNLFRPTIFLKNVWYIGYLKQGLILGNNKNIFNKKGSKLVDEFGLDLIDDEDDLEDGETKVDEDDKADGALVSSPKLLERAGMIIYGIISNRIFNNCVDMDYASLYPSIIIAFNISDMTLIGRLLVGKTPVNKYNPHMFDDGYSAGKDFIENLLTGNIPMIGSKWFNLPTIKELNDKLKDGRLLCY